MPYNHTINYGALNMATYRDTGIMSQDELVKNGYAPASRQARKTFEPAPFVAAEHYRYLPLHIQVRYRDKAVDVYMDGVDEAVHYLKDTSDFERAAPIHRTNTARYA